MAETTQHKSVNIGTVMAGFISYVESQAAAVDTAIYGLDNARERMPLPEEYNADRNFEDLPRLFPQIVRIFRGVLGSYLLYKFSTKPSRSEASADFLGQIEDFARHQGALAVGYARVIPSLIFKDLVIPHQNAIVLISEMKKDPFCTAPSVESMIEVAKVYASTTQIANKLARYLRKHGYSAFSGISLGGSVDHTRLAERASLGKIGYHGSLISPEQGARLRINLVYTNIENLPFSEENEHDWVLEFCAMCKKCIRECPADAIRDNPPPDESGRISVVDAQKCGPYMASNHGCGVCIAVCPFSIAGYDKIQTGFKRRRHRASQ